MDEQGKGHTLGASNRSLVLGEGVLFLAGIAALLDYSRFISSSPLTPADISDII